MLTFRFEFSISIVDRKISLQIVVNVTSVGKFVRFSMVFRFENDFWEPIDIMCKENHKKYLWLNT